MELALYHPVHGYYERRLDQVGREGDFQTSVSVGPLFGELLAWRFASWLEQHPPGLALHLVEAGAHQGQLARDILTGIARHHPDLLARITYFILEPSARRRTAQQTFLQEVPGEIRWVNDFADLDRATGGVRGIIFSNELLDAFPLHRLAWSTAQKCWIEQGITTDGDRLTWTPLPLPSAGKPPRPVDAALATVIPDGFAVESSPAAVSWWKQAAHSLCEGRLVALDYGLEADEFLDPTRAAGTLRGYRNHAYADDVLDHPGEQDLTAHVNWTAIRAAGEAAGLQTETITSQSRFLTTILRDWSVADPAAANLSPRQIRQFQTLTHPQHFGTRFQALVQKRR